MKLNLYQIRMQEYVMIDELFYILFFEMKSRILSAQPALNNIFLRIIPTQLVLGSSKKNNIDNRYRIFLEKGLQVMGKSTPVVSPAPFKGITFDLSKQENYFDFQTVNDKNLTYEFVLYEIDDDGKEERLESEKFDLSKQYLQFQNKGQTEFQNQLSFPITQMKIKWKLLIHNVSDTIKMLAHRLIRRHSSEKQHKFQENQKGLKKISELPSEENINSNMLATDKKQSTILNDFKQYFQECPTKKLSEKEAIQMNSNLQQQQLKNSQKTKKISLIILIMIILVGLIGSGVVPVSVLKPKKKPKKKFKY